MVKYGHISKPSDITRINQEIRESISELKTYNSIATRVRESQYLYTLSFTPNMRKNIYGQTETIRKRIKDQYTKTARFANNRLKELDIKRKFDTTID